MLNIWAILISMVVSVALGFLWYGPLFGKKWMALSGIKMPEQGEPMPSMKKPILLSFIGAILMSSVLTCVIYFHNAFYLTTGMSTALAMAAVVWFGFIVPVYLNYAGWEGKPAALFFINAGYWLVFLLISAAIISAFM
jgi:hypothetical protein